MLLVIIFVSFQQYFVQASSSEEAIRNSRAEPDLQLSPPSLGPGIFGPTRPFEKCVECASRSGLPNLLIFKISLNIFPFEC